MILDDKLMKYVLFKKRTTQEVRQKCKTLGFSEEYIEEIIAYLTENAYLDDEKYVMKYILNVIKLKKRSVEQIKFDLLRRGINENIIQKYITDELYQFELQSAIALANKKYKECSDILKTKKHLAGKGYSRQTINRAIEGLEKTQSIEKEIYWFDISYKMQIITQYIKMFLGGFYGRYFKKGKRICRVY